MVKTRKKIKKVLISLFSLLFLVMLSTAGLQQKRPEVPYVPTPEEVVAEMLRMADVDQDDVLYDLGCGDGRIVITAAKELGCRGVGIDIDPVRIQESRINASNAGVSDRVEFFQMDLFEADISQATVVTLYLLSKVNLRLRPKLFRELKPGTRVISHDFSMGEWTPEKTSVIEEKVDYVPFHDTRFIDDCCKCVRYLEMDHANNIRKKTIQAGDRSRLSNA
jgi:SAM-dependent methyltransferase